MKKYLILAISTLIIFLVAALAVTPQNSNQTFTHLSPSDFSKRILDKQYKLIDIRTIDEFNNGHIKSAIQNDYYQTRDFNTFLDSLDKNAKYLIYCHTGNRSGKTLQIMQEKGFANVWDLAGGIKAWAENGLPTEK